MFFIEFTWLENTMPLACLVNDAIKSMKFKLWKSYKLNHWLKTMSKLGNSWVFIQWIKLHFLNQLIIRLPQKVIVIEAGLLILQIYDDTSSPCNQSSFLKHAEVILLLNFFDMNFGYFCLLLEQFIEIRTYFFNGIWFLLHHLNLLFLSKEFVLKIGQETFTLLCFVFLLLDWRYIVLDITTDRVKLRSIENGWRPTVFTLDRSIRILLLKNYPLVVLLIQILVK